MTLQQNRNPKPVTPGDYDVVAAFFGTQSIQSTKTAPTCLFGLRDVTIAIDLKGGYGVSGGMTPTKTTSAFTDITTGLLVTIISKTQVRVEKL